MLTISFPGPVFSSLNFINECKAPETAFPVIKLFKTTIAKFVNRVDLDEMAHNEPAYLNIHCFGL